ncbi:MAG: UbiD family decarboxylase, partial [Elusimicrobia bacterium]|nr:UbiD family decarboxylase [Elusimicrobiota bacterium]
LLINVFGTEKRIEWALGRAPGEIGDELKSFADDMMPPGIGSLWKHRRLLWRAYQMKPRFTADPSVREIAEAPDLDALPVLKCWPQDGGRFLTYPLVVSRGPVSRKRNVGIYRMHIYDKSHTGMHCQIQKGVGFHYIEAERRGEALPLAVVLGADPASMFAGVLPVPEDLDAIAFAGCVRGRSVPMTRLANGLDVPADSEIVLEGFVPPRQRRMEGPFGDHFGHYSQAAPFPVFQVERMYHRRNAVYPAAVVGKPPQEDKYMGNAVQEMLLPLLKTMHPELVDLWAYYEAGFHNLAVAAVKQRYRKEAVKMAFSLLGEGQMSLTKCIFLVDPGVNVRDFSAVLAALRENFDPREDFLLLSGTAQDTLDFTGHAMNLGSKMVLDATQKKRQAAAPLGAVPVCRKAATERKGSTVSLHGLGPDVIASRNWQDALLVVKVRNGASGRTILERLVQEPSLAGFKLMAAVSEDVPLDDEELLLWGIFCRFDCARDFVPSKAVFCGGQPIFQGPLGFDATWKEGYPEPLVMDPAIVDTVNKRWEEYEI